MYLRLIAAFDEFVRHELRGHMDVVEMLVEQETEGIIETIVEPFCLTQTDRRSQVFRLDVERCRGRFVHLVSYEFGGCLQRERHHTMHDVRPFHRLADDVQIDLRELETV